MLVGSDTVDELDRFLSAYGNGWDRRAFGSTGTEFVVWGWHERVAILSWLVAALPRQDGS